MSATRNLRKNKLKKDFCKICLSNDMPVHSIVNTHLQAIYENFIEEPIDSQDPQSVLLCHKCCGRLQHCYQLSKSCQQNEELFSQLFHCCVKLERPTASPLQSPPEAFLSTMLQVDLIEEVRDITNITPTLSRKRLTTSPLQSPPEAFPSTMLQVVLIEENYDISEQDIEFEDSILAPSEVEINEDDRDDPLSGTPASASEENLENIYFNNTQIDAIETFNSTNSLEKSLEFSSNGVENNVIESHDAYSEENCISIELGHIECNRDRCFKCNICTKCFAQKQKLQNHIRVHSGEKPYKCDVCQKCFSQFSTLVSHNRTHTGEKPFKCYICEKGFTTKASRDKHVNVIHAGSKPFNCDFCLKSFSLRAKLDLHLSIHTGVKRFNCPMCGKSFNRRDRFHIHLRTHKEGRGRAGLTMSRPLGNAMVGAP